jgi:hypothetical protein
MWIAIHGLPENAFNQPMKRISIAFSDWAALREAMAGGKGTAKPHARWE